MKTDRYTKVVLTVIALALAWLCLWGPGPAMFGRPAKAADFFDTMRKAENAAVAPYASRAPSRVEGAAGGLPVAVEGAPGGSPVVVAGSVFAEPVRVDVVAVNGRPVPSSSQGLPFGFVGGTGPAGQEVGTKADGGIDELAARARASRQGKGQEEGDR